MVFLAVFLSFLVGCTATFNPNAHTPTAEGTPAGFWLGLWHGLILPIAFLISFFKSTVGVYEVHNNGGWYNAGFVIGAGLLHATRARPKRKKVEMTG